MAEPRRLLVVDGQGGRLGARLVEALRAARPQDEIVAVGTNSIATAAMLKAGAHVGASGENPVVVNSRTADVILGPMGMLAADSLHGEVTAAMAVAIGQSPAAKILLPAGRCSLYVAGAAGLSMGDAVDEAVALVNQLSEDANA